MDIERAKAVAEVAQVVVNSAKVEVDFLRITGGKGSGFITEKQITGPDSTPRVPNAALHKVRG